MVFAASLPLLALSASPVWRAGESVWRIPCLVALATLHLALLVRGRLPWATFAASGLGALVLLASPALPGSATTLPGPLPPILLPSAWLFGLAIYSVAAHAHAYRPVAVVVGLAGVAEVTASLWSGLPWYLVPAMPEAWRITVGLVGAGLVALAYACGRWRALRRSTDDLGERWSTVADERATTDLDHAVAQQQARMAREVQRAVAEHLDEILDKAREGRRAARRAPALADDALADISQQGEEALGRVHSLLALLDAPDPEEVVAHEPVTAVLAPEHALSPQPQLEDLPKLIDAARGEGLTVTLELIGQRGELSVAAQLALYRTVQEALTNTIRHAGPGAVAHVEIDWEGENVAVLVEDIVPPRNVVAGDLDEAVFTGGDTDVDYVEGRGLRVVRERLESLDGHLEVEQMEDGYRVRGVVPRDASLLRG